jgi:hypothetical protein
LWSIIPTLKLEGTWQLIVKAREQRSLHERKEEDDLVEITNDFMVEITSLKKHKLITVL